MDTTFATTVDYMAEDRPFFVKIGKDGLIAALEKLNHLLIEVSLHRASCRSLSHPFCL